MADEFQSGMCSTGSWWCTSRTAGFDGTAAVSSVSCSTPMITDIGIGGGGGGRGGGGFGWPAAEVAADGGKARSGDEPVGSGSGSSITYQDSHKAHVSDPMIPGGSLIDSSLQMAGFGISSPSAINWNQALMRSSGRAETSFHALLQEDLSSSRPYLQQQESSMEAMNQGFLVDQHHHLSSGNLPLVSASYGYPSPLLQGLLEPENKPLYQSPMTSNYNRGGGGGTNELSQASSWSKFPQLMKSSAPNKQSLSNQLQFSNNTQFWNASDGAAGEARPSFYTSTPPPPHPDQFPIPNFEQKPTCSSLTTIKNNLEGVRESNTSGGKKGGSEPAFKKPRIETPSPLPTFKVRKEKLGDRITALQQLVSPFGKTDTASVLHEAIEYIKFLHEQVGVLSTPYLKNGHPMQQQQQQQLSSEEAGKLGPKQDLRSRGLCLVPIANTFPVASETTADFWTPTFGGTYR